MHVNIRENFHLMHQSVCHAPVDLRSTLGTLTQMLQKHCAHESATRVGAKFMETKVLDDHFRQGMLNLLKEKSVQFGADGNKGDGDIEDSTLIFAELELEDMVNM